MRESPHGIDRKKFEMRTHAHTKMLQICSGYRRENNETGFSLLTFIKPLL